MNNSAPAKPIPRLSDYDGVLFDLDGVLTPTADVHRRAWRDTFEEVFAHRRLCPPYCDEDYFVHVDGKHRYDGVASVLASRHFTLAWGSDQDSPSGATICGIGNRKNDRFTQILSAEGVDPYPGSLAVVGQLFGAAVPMGVVSSSKNADAVLTAAGLRHQFQVVVDGTTATHTGLPGKPAPDMFLYAAQQLCIEPTRTVVVEDALPGVRAAHAGEFGLVVGVDRGTGAQSLRAAGAHCVVTDLALLLEAPH